MLGKLLKYELKASARTLLPLYAGTLLIALVCGVSMAIRVDNMNELVDCYGEQLEIYAAAAEKIFSKPVKEKIIYSFCLNKIISF